jgi:hypothetical protein
MLDIFSRYSLGWLVVDQESALVVRSWIEQVVAAGAGSRRAASRSIPIGAAR